MDQDGSGVARASTTLVASPAGPAPAAESTTPAAPSAVADEVARPARRARRPRRATAERRAEILRAAAHTFGTKGYKTGSLADVAEQVGITHAGVLHHFGTKEQLLVEVLDYRDKEDVRELAGQHIPDGIDLFHHLVRTARANERRRGIVQGFTVLTGESVTEDHPARDWVIDRYTTLRGQIVHAVQVVGGPGVTDATATAAANAIIAVMDGLQVQWLLDEPVVQLAEQTRIAIEAILAAACPDARIPTLG